jgi:hypothetical protein
VEAALRCLDTIGIDRIMIDMIDLNVPEENT